MNVYDASEIAYKNGYEAGKQEFTEQLHKAEKEIEKMKAEYDQLREKHMALREKYQNSAETIRILEAKLSIVEPIFRGRCGND